jgi:hypothetical protein
MYMAHSLGVDLGDVYSGIEMLQNAAKQAAKLLSRKGIICAKNTTFFNNCRVRNLSAILDIFFENNL